MSKIAWGYVGGVIGAAILMASIAWLHIPPSQQFITLTILVIITTAAHLFEAEAPNRQSYYPSMIFLFAGVLLLTPALFVLLAILPHLIEWIKARIRRSKHLAAWYIQPFNIATHIIAGLAAGGLYAWLPERLGIFHSAASVIVATIAALLYVLLNHLMVGLALVLARGISWRDSGVLEIENLLPDFINLCLGYIVAVFWLINPWLILPVLSPIVLIYRALTVPQLKQEAQSDAKTGLLNARYFNKTFLDEFERAQRFERPLALIVADLDLMRNINNTYGHLAGDAVLAGIGAIIRATVRKYDVAGRFGGEEFCVVLPEVGPEAAQALAERLRAAVEAGAFTVSTHPEPIRATLSIGIACFPQDGASTTELMHAADIAVYQSKLGGRNRVTYIGDVPHSVTIEEMQNEYRAGLARTAAGDGATPSPAELSPAPSSASQTQPPAEPAVAKPAAAPSAPPAAIVTAVQQLAGNHQPLFWLYVASVIAAGMGIAIWGFVHTDRVDGAALGLLSALALIAELLRVNIYERLTFSVSVALIFAAALIAGLPGVACIGMVTAVTHYFQHRPLLYKSAFNWSTQMLGGLLPVIAFEATGGELALTRLYPLLAAMAIAGFGHYLLEVSLIATFVNLHNAKPTHTPWRDQLGWLAWHYTALCVMGLFLSLAYIEMGSFGVCIFMLPVLMMRFAQKQYTERTEDGMRELKRMNQELQRANHEIMIASQSIRQQNDELFVTLAKIIDARDPYASGHAAKVADYALLIARELGFDYEQQTHAYRAGLLHDIGKLGVPEEILNKPGRLDPAEYTRIKTHAALGAEFLDACQGLRHLAPFVRYHHERWDGHGYPCGLAGEEIPLIARILNVCDSVEAMASDRPYHQGMPVDRILAEIERQAGHQFDPTIAAAFVQIIQREGQAIIVNTTQAITQRPAAQLRMGELVLLT